MAKKPTKLTPKSQSDFILLDRSGSMASKWTDAIGGINSYISTLAKDKETASILVTVAMFDSGGFDILREATSAKDCKEIGLNESSPRGSTPLYDAIGKLVNRANSAAPEKAAIVIVTDGYENASHEVSKNAAKAMLDTCRAKNWQVLFLGADFDNFDQANSLGNAAGATIQAASANLASTMRSTAQMRSSYSSSNKAMLYSDEDRKKALSK